MIDLLWFYEDKLEEKYIENRHLLLFELFVILSFSKFLKNPIKFHQKLITKYIIKINRIKMYFYYSFQSL